MGTLNRRLKCWVFGRNVSFSSCEFQVSGIDRILFFAGDIEVEDYYVAFLDMVKHVLDGSMEPNAFEETLREMFSTRAFYAFTIDKIIANAVRQVS